MKQVLITLFAAVVCAVFARSVGLYVVAQFSHVHQALQQTGASPPMNTTLILAYLVTALASSTPTMKAVQYVVGIIKPTLKANIQNAQTRGLIIWTGASALGAIILPLLAAGVGSAHIAPPIAPSILPVYIIVGVAAGLAACGDKDLMAALDAVAQSGSLLAGIETLPAPSSTIVGELSPQTPPTDPPTA